MTREALKLVHDALINSSDALWNEYQSDWRHGIPTRRAQLDAKLKMCEDHDKAIAAIKAALAQPEQEPVAWWDAKLGVFDEKHFDQLQPLYTSPPKREWVGLTNEEYTNIAHRTASKYAHRTDPNFIAYTFLPHTLEHFVQLIEKTLKERNT
jgi:hypothetical protein